MIVNIVNWSILLMNVQKHWLVKLTCSDYGFECNFVSEGEIEQVLDEFRQHSENEHGIDYPKEALMQIILRKTHWMKILKWL